LLTASTSFLSKHNSSVTAIILGLNSFHGDSSAALVQDGRLLATAEEKRFRRSSIGRGIPSQSIAYCPHQTGLRLADVIYVAINQDGRSHRAHEIAYLVAHPS
jgi:carbamoyltransferase